MLFTSPLGECCFAVMTPGSIVRGPRNAGGAQSGTERR